MTTQPTTTTTPTVEAAMLGAWGNRECCFAAVTEPGSGDRRVVKLVVCGAEGVTLWLDEQHAEDLTRFLGSALARRRYLAEEG